MGITIRDIAREAGVSTATVSRSLRGLPNVDRTTRERVLEVARRHDYVISPAASRLATGRTGSIAVVTPFIARWFFARVLSGIERELQAGDLDVLLLGLGDPVDKERHLPVRKLRRRVDGVLALCLPPDDDDLLALLELGIPTSLVGTVADGVPSVGIDDVAGARTATQHLINLGHERVGLIHGRPERGPFIPERDRVDGFVEAMTGSGLVADPQLMLPGYFTVEGGEHAMTELLARRQPPTAVFAISDEMAFGALRALRRHGLAPGRDIAVIGFDDHDMADLLDLSTIAQPVEELGVAAAHALLERLADPDAAPARRILPTRLVVRGSTAAQTVRRRGEQVPALAGG